MTTDHLADVNDKVGKLDGSLNGQQLALAMDQSSRTSWDVSVTPFVGDLPFSMAGKGNRCP